MKNILTKANILTTKCMTNILGFYIEDSIQNEVLKKEFQNNRILINENNGSYMCYFNLTSEEKYLTQVLGVLKKKIMK